MSSRFEAYWRIFRLGYQNFWRNRWLTIGATLLMTLTLTMISVSLLFSFIVQDTAEVIRSKIDVTIYFRDDTVPDSKLLELSQRIKNQAGVLDVTFVGKTEALTIWKRLPINESVKKPVSDTNNPLPRSLLVDAENPDLIQGVVSSIEVADSEKIVCSECVSYARNKDTINRLVSVTRLVQRVGFFLSIFFGVIAIFNVLNIIRLTIAARSDEIEIMRYVGASNAFIRGPFMVEGVLYGVLGTLVTTLFLLGITALVSPYISGTFSINDTDFFHYLLNHLPLLVAAQLAIGVVLGVIVSILSMRKYLRV